MSVKYWVWHLNITEVLENLLCQELCGFPAFLSWLLLCTVIIALLTATKAAGTRFKPLCKGWGPAVREPCWSAQCTAGSSAVFACLGCTDNFPNWDSECTHSYRKHPESHRWGTPSPLSPLQSLPCCFCQAPRFAKVIPFVEFRFLQEQAQPVSLLLSSRTESEKLFKKHCRKFFSPQAFSASAW